MRFRNPLQRAALAPVLALALLSSPRPTVAGTLIERTVAFVNKKPVLRSDVELTRALLRVDEKEALEKSIEEVLMLEEASRLLDEPPPAESLASAVMALQERAGPGFGLPAFKRKALAQLAIARYVDVRLRPLVRVEDAEIRRVFNEKVVSDSQPPAFSLVAAGIREMLERRALDQRIEEWVQSLRRREEVRRPPLDSAKTQTK